MQQQKMIRLNQKLNSTGLQDNFKEYKSRQKALELYNNTVQKIQCLSKEKINSIEPFTDFLEIDNRINTRTIYNLPFVMKELDEGQNGQVEIKYFTDKGIGKIVVYDQELDNSIKTKSVFTNTNSKKSFS